MPCPLRVGRERVPGRRQRRRPGRRRQGARRARRQGRGGTGSGVRGRELGLVPNHQQHGRHQHRRPRAVRADGGRGAGAGRHAGLAAARDEGRAAPADPFRRAGHGLAGAAVGPLGGVCRRRRPVRPGDRPVQPAVPRARARPGQRLRVPRARQPAAHLAQRLRRVDAGGRMAQPRAGGGPGARGTRPGLAAGVRPGRRPSHGGCRALRRPVRDPAAGGAYEPGCVCRLRPGVGRPGLQHRRPPGWGGAGVRARRGRRALPRRHARGCGALPRGRDQPRVRLAGDQLARRRSAEPGAGGGVRPLPRLAQGRVRTVHGPDQHGADGPLPGDQDVGPVPGLRRA